MIETSIKPTDHAEGPASEGASTGVVAPRSGFHLSSGIIVTADPGSVQAEAISGLRTHLLAQHIRDGRRSLTICATSENSGASHVAANLAISFAMAGVDTLLIDADMRSPSLENFITPDTPHEGLQQCLSDPDLPVDDVIQADIIPHLSVLYSGGATANAQELLASRAFPALVDHCLRKYEVTIVDTPPSNTSADSRRIASAVRYAMIVARRNHTFTSDVKTLIDDLTADRAKVIGSFLNDF
ncbi:MAG: CpsD/CapB family tyrosine-protein kinase [Novosphingobium sp.]